MDHDGDRVEIPVGKVLTITVGSEPGTGTSIQDSPSMEDWLPRPRSHSVWSRRSTKSTRSKANSTKSITSIRSMPDQDFDTSNDEVFHQPATASSARVSNKEEKPRGDLLNQEFIIREAREEWDETPRCSWHRNTSLNPKADGSSRDCPAGSRKQSGRWQPLPTQLGSNQAKNHSQ